MKIGSDIPKRIGALYAGRGEPENARLLALLFWRGALLLATIAVVIIFVWALFSVFGILADLSIATQSALPQASFNRGNLDATVAALQARQTRLDVERKSGAPAIPDPSIAR